MVPPPSYRQRGPRVPTHEQREYTVVGERIVDKLASGRMWTKRVEVWSWSGSALGLAQAVWDVSSVDRPSRLTDARPNEGFASVEDSKTVRATD